MRRQARRLHPTTLAELRGAPTRPRVVIRSNVPVVVQHSRLDTRQPALAVLSTIAFALD